MRPSTTSITVIALCMVCAAASGVEETHPESIEGLITTHNSPVY